MKQQRITSLTAISGAMCIGMMGLVNPTAAKADEISELKAVISQLQSRIEKLEKSTTAQPTPSGQAATPTQTAQTTQTTPPSAPLQTASSPGTITMPTVTTANPGQRQLALNYGPNKFELGGILNASFDHTSISGFTPGGANDPRLASNDNRIFAGNASRLNFTFTRTLSRDYQVQAFIDSSIVPTAGSGTLAGRENWLAAFSPIGTFRIGRIDTPVKQMGVYTDVFYATGIPDDGQIDMMGGEDQLIGFTRRQQKSLRYDSPNMAGFSLAAQIALPNADGAATADAPTANYRKGQIYSGSLSYANGPFLAGVGVEIHNNLRFTNSAGLTDKGIRVGAKYIFTGIGDIAVGGNIFSYEGPNGTNAIRPFATLVGNIYVGSGKIVMRYGHAGNVRGSAPDGTVICGLTNTATSFTSCNGALELIKGPDSGASQYVIGYDYAIDSQTSVYTAFSRIKNSANANYNYGTNGYGILKPGNSVQGITAGAIYSF